MKVIIAGGRDFSDYESLKHYCKYLLKNQPDVEIVCGMARGADMLGKRYAEEHGLKVKKFPAQWNKYGKRAGYLRNADMADYADSLIAFWNKKSKGTKHMIDLAREKGLNIRIYYY